MNTEIHKVKLDELNRTCALFKCNGCYQSRYQPCTMIMFKIVLMVMKFIEKVKNIYKGHIDE